MFFEQLFIRTLTACDEWGDGNYNRGKPVL